jgi:hypothetical protein
VLVTVSRREIVPGHGDQHAKGCHDRMMPAV